MFPRPLLLGHRGLRPFRAQLLKKIFRKLPPENSIEAFDLALEQGAHGFEFDVRCTADHKAIVCHDPVIEHMRISQCTLEQLRSRVPYIPTLEEVLGSFGRRSFLDIELKVPGLETQTLELVHRHCERGSYVVSSFLPEVIDSLAKLDSHVPLGHIFNTRENATLWRSLPVAYVIPSQPLATDDLIDEVIQAGKRVIPWTINAPRHIRHLIGLGVTGFITDDPALASRTVAELTQPATPAD